MANLFDRAGMSTATSGAGMLTLGSALGPVAPNLAGFLSFSGAGVADQNIVSYLILDVNGNWETGWGVYTASGTTLTRNVTKSSNANAAISLSGNAQVFVTARAEDLATVEALAAANLAINGGMEISQFNGGNVITLPNASNIYVVDGFICNYANATMVMKGSQINFALQNPPLGFAYALQLQATTGAALGVNDAVDILHPIEGYRWQRLGYDGAGFPSLPVTIGFWIFATVGGTMTVSIRNGAVGRSYVGNVVLNGGGWEWHAIIIPGDTIGAWNTTNTVGAYVGFCFGAGANVQGTNNSWNSGSLIGTSATTNFFATNNNVVAMTGLVILPGAHQLSQEHASLMVRPADVELALCQRYYEKSYDLGSTPGSAVAPGVEAHFIQGLPSAAYTSGAPIRFKTRKRTAPAMTSYSPSTGASGKIRDAQNGADVTAAFANIGETGCFVQGTMSAAATTINLQAHWVADARM